MDLGLGQPRRHDNNTDDNGGICCHLLAVRSVLGPVLSTADVTPWSLLWCPGLTPGPTPPHCSSLALCTPASPCLEVNLAPSFFFSKNNTFVLLVVTKAICSYCRDKSNFRKALKGSKTRPCPPQHFDPFSSSLFSACRGSVYSSTALQGADAAGRGFIQIIAWPELSEDTHWVLCHLGRPRAQLGAPQVG